MLNAYLHSTYLHVRTWLCRAVLPKCAHRRVCWANKKCHHLDLVHARTFVPMITFSQPDSALLVPVASGPDIAHAFRYCTKNSAIHRPIVQICSVKYVNKIDANHMCARVRWISDVQVRSHTQDSLSLCSEFLATGHMYAVRTVCISSPHLALKITYYMRSREICGRMTEVVSGNGTRRDARWVCCYVQNCVHT